MTKISAVIVAHNEEKKIAGCLESLNFVDEIVVVLDKCTDSTKEIVAKYTDKIIEGSWNIEGARRNVAVNAASGDWILEIDADERISSQLAQEIVEITKNSQPCLIVAPIANYIGKRYVRYGWLRTLGVLSRQTMHYRGMKIYEEDKEIHPTAIFKECEKKYLQNSITHLVDEDVADLINRFNRYTNWRASDIIRSNKIHSSCFKILSDFFYRFFKSFVIKRGYKERGLGFLIAVLAGLYPLVSTIKAKEKLAKNQ